jgi:DNA anti-recombination protein RmuC
LFEYVILRGDMNKPPKWFAEFVDKQFKPFTTKIEADVSNIKSDVSDLKVRMTKVEDTLQEHGKQITNLSTKLDTVIKLNNLRTA